MDMEPAVVSRGTVSGLLASRLPDSARGAAVPGRVGPEGTATLLLVVLVAEFERGALARASRFCERTGETPGEAAGLPPCEPGDMRGEITRGDTERGPIARMGGLRKGACRNGRETGASAVAPPVLRCACGDAIVAFAGAATTAVTAPLGIEAGVAGVAKAGADDAKDGGAPFGGGEAAALA